MKSTTMGVGIFVAAVITGATGLTIYNSGSADTDTANDVQSVLEIDAKHVDEIEAIEAEVEEEGPRVVIVQPGDTLAKIAKREEATPKQIFNANDELSHPDELNPGQELIIPEKSEELPDRFSEVMAAIEAERAEAQRQVAAHESQRRQASQQQRTAQPPAPATRQQPAVQSTSNASAWDRLAQCESGGNWSINTGNGYYGGLQFSLSSWRAVGGSGYPHQASKAEQISRAERLLAIQGWGAWPACSSKLGLR